MLTLLLISMLISIASAMSPEARESFAAFERRAEAGDSAAQFRLSAILETGYDSIPADTIRSLSLLRRSAAAGYAPAQNYLGFLFQQGRILPENRDSAILWISKAADAGDPKARHNLAFNLLQTSRNTDSIAARYLSLAAEDGLPQSMTLLADLYAEGRGVPVDTLRAVALYEDAIARRFPDAQLRLLNMMGPKWINLNADESLKKSKYYWNLGAPVIAVELLRNIGPAEPETAQAYALLGHAYSHGLGVNYDHRKANEYFARAAILGNPSAAFILAETLEIFPDALAGLLPDLPESMTAGSLRALARRSGITSPEQATAALF